MRRSARSRSLLERLQALLEEPLPHSAHELTRGVQPCRNFRVLHPSGGVENDSSPNHLTVRGIRRSCALLDHRSLIVAQLDSIRRYPPHTHPPRTLCSRKINSRDQI